MFTGIVERTARIQAASRHGGILRVRIERPRAWKLSIGGSVSVNGICSTVVQLRRNSFDVEYMPETLAKTTAGMFSEGTPVNLERPLRAGDPLGGHFVQGHIDGRGIVESVMEGGAEHLVRIRVPRQLSPLILKGGSVTVDGVSLTVARKLGVTFSVALIPHTLKMTTLSSRTEDDEVNIEADMIARAFLAARRGDGRVRRNAAKRIRKKAAKR